MMHSGSLQKSSHSPALISYDVKPSPRVNGENDVKNYIEMLMDNLKNA